MTGMCPSGAPCRAQLVSDGGEIGRTSSDLGRPRLSCGTMATSAGWTGSRAFRLNRPCGEPQYHYSDMSYRWTPPQRGLDAARWRMEVAAHQAWHLERDRTVIGRVWQRFR